MFLLTDPCLRPGTFSPGECGRLIGMFDASPDIAAGRLSGGVETATRICRTLWMDDTPDTSWMFQRLAALVAEVNRETFHFDLDDFRESAQILRYDAPAGQSATRGATAAGRYDTHVDIGAGGHSATRKLSLSVQLSAEDSYSGGGLQIGSDDQNWSAPRDAGTAILFPSFVRHRIMPLTIGTRYALVAWVHGPAFR
jgi:PKHD-type hydroxylase